jgi:sodium transport system permease protein
MNLRGIWTVFAKEMVDALRDRRTLVVVLLSSVLMGPLVMIALSAVVASFETRAERRELYVDHLEHAPTLINFLQRQGFQVHAAPADYE